MNDIISKELLSEVSKERIREFEPFGTDRLKIIFLRDINFAPCDHPPRIEKDCGVEHIIDIDKLARKCKKWALAKDCEIAEFKSRCEVWDETGENMLHVSIEHDCNYFNPAHVFKCGQWILEHK